MWRREERRGEENAYRRGRTCVGGEGAGFIFNEDDFENRVGLFYHFGS